MPISPYRLRLKLRNAKRDYPLISILEITISMAFSLGVLVVVTGGLYYLLTTIAPH